MPTKVRWIGKGPSELRNSAATGDLEDHIAEIWEKRGVVEIIGGFLFEQKNPAPAKTTAAKTVAADDDVDMVTPAKAADPVETTRAVGKSPRKK